MVCVPEKVRAAPRNIVEAQFSIPYSVAAAWIDGRLGLEHFTDEGVQRADLLALAARVQPYIDADIDREWSRSISPANVTIEFRDGKVLDDAGGLSQGTSEQHDDGSGVRGENCGLRDLRCGFRCARTQLRV